MTTYQNIVNRGTELPVTSAFKRGHNVLEISTFNDLPVEQVRSIIEKFQKSQGQNA
jgi:hypothetical protein